MSTACARGFLLRMKSDVEFFFRVAAMEDADERLAFIRSQGFDCTAEEIAQSFGTLHELPPEVDRKLWKEQLPPDPEFRCETERVGECSAIITIKGELDLATAGQFRDVLSDLHKHGVTDHLAIDLTGCTFIDSTGITALIEAQQAAGSPLVVATCTAQSCRALEVTGLDRVFVILDSREQAIATLEKRFGTL